MSSGLILFNKSAGITSFDSLRDIKRKLGTGKVGHTGTLDKFAQGLLIVLTGKALKLSKYFSACDKKYIGKIHFGIETDTLDPEGKIIAQAELPSKEIIEQVLPQFTGDIMQSPPSYSAIRLNGKRASDLVRSGKEPEMKKRPVTIYKLELLNWNSPFAEIYVHCSSGTYIRSLTRDIALAAGSRAHLCELTRTHVGEFNIEDSSNLQPIDKSVINKLGMPWFEVEQHEVEHILHGKPLDQILINKTLFSSNFSVPPCYEPFGSMGVKSFNQIAAIFCKDTFIAVVEKIDNKCKYGFVM